MSERLDAIRDRLAKATPGPWHQGRDFRGFEDARDIYSEREPSETSRDIARAGEPEDAALIATAPADLAYLLAELDKARAASVVHVSHYDMEARAVHFNEGYEAAMSQHLADDPSLAEDWLNTKLAEAWDEGYADGAHDEHEHRPGRKTTNPYKEAP